MNFDDPLSPRTPARSLAGEAATLGDLLGHRAAATPGRRAWRHKVGGRWIGTTWAQVMSRATALATWMIDQGVERGDKICVVGQTGPQWCIADLASQLCGAVCVGAYPTLSPPQLAYIVDHSDAKIAIVQGRDEVAKLRAEADATPKLERIVVWDADVEVGDDPRLSRWQDALDTEPDAATVAVRTAAVDPADCALIVYTSGTTGPPKGAMLSHLNVLAVLRADSVVAFDADDEGLSFLPMAHVAERILGFYNRVAHGTATAYATSVSAVLAEIKEVRPTLFGSVPRVFEKAYAHVQSQVAEAPPARQRVFRWAETVGHRAVADWQEGRAARRRSRAAHLVADQLVFRRIREAFGGRVRFFVTGAAPIPRRILEFFWAAGFPIFEAYGMTEATVLSHANLPGRTRLGSVGQALSFIEHRIADDGEILVRGPTVFMGYYKDEAATRATVDADGWLLTGDIGRIDDDGFLYILDRKKHIIITAGGKNLTPANIESAIKVEDPLISQVHAHGDRRPYVTALVTLSPLDVIEWARTRGIVPGAEADRLRAALLDDPLARPPGLEEVIAAASADADVRRRIVAAVARGNVALSRVERIKRVLLLPRELSLADGELTPTMKVKRKAIETKFAADFDRIYADAAAALVIESA
jgi:long-chain acyl-CoA synthetase